MDFYNRYLMRQSGEKQHQMVGRTEHIVATLFDSLRARNMLPKTEEECQSLAKMLLIKVSMLNEAFDKEAQTPYRAPSAWESFRTWLVG